MPASLRLLKSFRTWHLYLGVFTAPALLFFAFTGALQSVALHEASRTSDYKPPAWLASIAHLHKKQSLDVPVKKRAPTRAAAAGAGIVPNAKPASRADSTSQPAPRKRNLWPMKGFFLLVSLSLFLSTSTGVYMGWRCTRHRRRYGATLAAGIVVPALLLMI
ncbi:MAG TPA: PepSY domain-containing protein [Rhodanobacteraceae bacterium]|nr:PepSY domain-containing protein [Rhodanobacteraceae bacterium]